MACYDPLLSPASIRLVKLHRGLITDQPSFALDVFHLDGSPPFDALSYTWGNPFPECLPLPESHVGVDFDLDSETTLCNGRPFKVRRNLLDALRRLQALPTPRLDHIHQSEYIWIDAICIDQSNLEERAGQVQIMGKIYAQAEAVIVWLGEGDETVPAALSIIHRLAPFVELPESSRDQAAARAGMQGLSQISSYDIHDPAAIRQKLGIEFPETHEWLAFLVLMARPYFKRAWILQEIILAKSPVVVIGSSSCSFEMFSAALYFLAWTGWAPQLDPELFRGVRRVALETDERCAALRGVLDLEYTPMLSVTSILTCSGMPEEGWPFQPLLRQHRIREATDPRDKIYSLIGISRVTALQTQADSHVSGILKPNYRLSVRTLYIQTTRLILRERQNLHLLLGKESPIKTKLRDLPSWISDYTVAQVPGMMTDDAKAWCASDEPRWDWDGRGFEDPLLGARGYCVGVVMEHSIYPVNERQVPILGSVGKLAENLPVYYRDDASKPT